MADEIKTKSGATKPRAQPGEGAVGAKKPTVCLVSAAQFEDQAPATIELDIGGTPKTAVRKLFKTGSFGWFCNDKMDVRLADGTTVKVQVGVNLTVVGSKTAART